MATEDCKPCEGRGIKGGYAQPVWLCSEQIQDIIDGLPDHEFIYESVCFRETADNSVKHERVTIVPFLNDIQQATITIWYLDDGTVTAIAPAGIERCITDKNQTEFSFTYDGVLGTSIPVGFVGTIPAGTVQFSIVVRTGVATINAAPKPTGYIRNEPPVINGDGGNLLYASQVITAATGILDIVYHTK